MTLPEQFGKYRIVRQLGQGGMGTVFLAQDTVLQRPVALKICHLAGQPQALQRFRREARAAAALRHPNLCPVYEYAEREGIVYLTMAFIEGPSLREWLPEHPLSQWQAARLVAKLALAIQVAHAHGVIHRDLKPSNIVMEHDEPVIVDFGLARLQNAGTHLTQLDRITGTPAYMAPEQAGGDPAQVGPGCDVYSLGVILYELLTGAVPFKGSLVTVAGKLLTEPPPPLRAKNAAVDQELETICLKALAKLPEQRYPSAQAFAAVLMQAISRSDREPLPSGASRTTGTYRAASARRGKSLPPRTSLADRPSPAAAAPARLPKRTGDKAPPAGRWRGWLVLSLALLSALPLGILWAVGTWSPPGAPTTGGAGESAAPDLARSKTPRNDRRQEDHKNNLENALIVSARGDGAFATVQAALRVAGAGATIRVQPGTYKEGLVIDKPVKVIGDGPIDQIIIESSGAPCVRMETDSAFLRGLTLRARPGKGRPACAVEILRGKLEIEGCDISSETLGGLDIQGLLTEAMLRRCKVHDCKETGILIHAGGQATVEECEVFGNGSAGVEVREGGNPLLRHCTLRDGKQAGLLIHQGGKGTYQDCEFFGNSQANVEIRTGGDPTLRLCKIANGKADGVFVHSQGKGTLESCEITGNADSGARIAEESSPVFRNCKIHDGKQRGVLFLARARGKLVDCFIYDNLLTGVKIQDAETNPELSRCQIYGNKPAGIAVEAKGQGTVAGCDVFDNALSGILIRTGASVHICDCKIHDGKQAGLGVVQEGKATVERCDIYGNGWAGFEVLSNSTADIKHCKIHDGKQGGLVVALKAKVTAQDCDFHGNAFSGIEVRENGNADLKDCRINRNKQAGIWAHKQGRGTVNDCNVTNNGRRPYAIEEGSRLTGNGNTPPPEPSDKRSGM